MDINWDVSAYGVKQASDEVEYMVIRRKSYQPCDVLIKILYCGVCHSDLHHIRNDWGDSMYPLVPGHEIVGEVKSVGPKVTKFKIGDKVAVGNVIDSCLQCENCQKDQDQYCANGGPTWTYNGRVRFADGHRTVLPEGEVTYGGYSTHIICCEKFVLRAPVNLDLASAAPFMCAGITMYTPLKMHRLGRGHVVGIAGIGGLGHLGVKLAKARGCTVIALTTSEWKVNDAIGRLGADDAILMTDENKLKNYEGKLDFIISTIPVAHDVDPYLQLLKKGEGRYHVVGNMNNFPGLIGFDFVFYGKEIHGSNTGGIADTQELIDFCDRNRIYADVEVIRFSQVPEKMKKMENKEVKYRYVVDVNMSV